MKRSGSVACTLVATSALALYGTVSAEAQGVADFYKGKQITVAVGYAPGGGYDLYARTVSRHMVRHVPGNPALVVQNMPGAGSRTAANWLYNVAPKDGTAIGTMSQNTPLDQALKQDGVQFDASRFNWIGNPIVDINVTISWTASGLTTMEDVLSKGGMICGGTGPTSTDIMSAQVLNNLLDANIQIIFGYPGGNDVNLAIERGELNCRGGWGWSSLNSTAGNWLDEGTISVLVQWGVESVPEISQRQGREVPLITDLAKTEADRRALDLIVAPTAIGRPLIAPPDVPEDRVTALRRAFDATMADKTFLAEAEKQRMEINPLPGERLQKIAAETALAPSEVAERAIALTTPRGLKELKQ